jgi:hypothetical protein
MTTAERLAPIQAARAAYLATATNILRTLFAELCVEAPKLQTLEVVVGPDNYRDAEGGWHTQWMREVNATKTDGFTFTTGQRSKKGELWLQICSLADTLEIELKLTLTRDEL